VVAAGGAVDMKTLERTHILETLASVSGSRSALRKSWHERAYIALQAAAVS